MRKGITYDVEYGQEVDHHAGHEHHPKVKSAFASVIDGLLRDLRLWGGGDSAELE